MMLRFLWIACLPAVLAAGGAGGEARPPRLLWEVPATRFSHRPRQIVPAGDKVLVFTWDVLYALEAKTGRECWRYPQQGVVRIDDVSAYVLKVLGDEVIVRSSPGQEGPGTGCAALRLSNGSLIRTLILKEVRRCHACWSLLPGTEFVVWYPRDQENRVWTVHVLDVRKWAETARFTLPEVDGDVMALSGKVYGVMRRGKEKEPFSRCFAVDLKQAVLYSSPMRERHSHPEWTLDADGTRHFREGSFSPTCAYLGPGRETDNLEDPRVRARYSKPQWCSSRVTSDEVAAEVRGSFLWVADARTKAMRAGIRVSDAAPYGEDMGDRDVVLAFGAECVYYGWAGGLRAYATWPVDPARPDPEDPGDPAWAIARTRTALEAGDLDRALNSLRGIGGLLLLRPAQRAEAVALLSQLARLPASRHSPDLWQSLVWQDGWIAGELLLDEYAKPGPMARLENLLALLRIGTPRALGAAAALLDVPPDKLRWDGAHSFWVAVEAARRLHGKAPWEKALAGGGWAAAALLLRPVDDATFERLAPLLPPARPFARSSDSPHSSLLKEAWFLTPEQLVRWVGDQVTDEELGRVVAASKALAALRGKGEGDREPIEIEAPPASKAEDF